MLKTFVAPLLTEEPFTPICDEKGQPIYWFDKMFHGGLRRPLQLQRPVIVLLCGPPGAGKSLLAQQICYARAAARINEVEPGLGTSILVSAETPAPVIAENLDDLGFQREIKKFPVFAAVEYGCKKTQDGVDVELALPEETAPFLILSPREIEDPATKETLVDQIFGCWKRRHNDVPDVLVIDSLNVLAGGVERTTTHKQFDGFNQTRAANAKKKGHASPESSIDFQRGSVAAWNFSF